MIGYKCPTQRQQNATTRWVLQETMEQLISIEWRCEIHPITGQVYFTSTTNGKVYRFDDLGLSIANFETYEIHPIPLIMARVKPRCPLDSLTTFALTTSATYITQDGGEGNVGCQSSHNDLTNPSIDIFANTPNSCEPTGISFTPDYRFMFMYSASKFCKLWIGRRCCRSQCCF